MAGKWQQWYPHMIDAWQGSATIQTFTHAAYRGFHNLIMEQFQAEDGKLPDDDKQLAKLSRLGVEWAGVAGEIREALTPDGKGKLYSATQFELWQGASERHQSYIDRMAHLRSVKSAAKHPAQDCTGSVEIPAQSCIQAENGLKETKTRKETRKETKTLKDTCAEASSTPIVAARDDRGEPLTLPLVNGNAWPVPAADCLEWASAYPGINVLTELLKMRGWLDANPRNRKTPAGVRRFIVGWMGRAQNSSRPTGESNGNGNRGQARTNGNIAAGQLAARRIADRLAHGVGGGAGSGCEQ